MTGIFQNGALEFVTLDGIYQLFGQGWKILASWAFITKLVSTNAIDNASFLIVYNVYLFPFSKSATNCAKPISVNGCFNNP